MDEDIEDCRGNRAASEFPIRLRMKPLLDMQKSPQGARYYFIQVIFVCAALRLVDLFFWSTSFILAYNYYEHMLQHNANLTVLFALAPTLAFMALSTARVIHNVNKSTKVNGDTRMQNNNYCQVIMFVLFPQLGAYYKLIKLLEAATNHSLATDDTKSQHLHFVIHLKDEATLFYIASSFIQSVLQFILQGYLFFSQNTNSDTGLGDLQILTIVSSLICLSCAVAASEQKSLVFIEWISIVSALLWKLFSLASRLLCLVLLISMSISYFLLFCIIHALLFSIVVTFRSKLTESRCESLALSPLIGIIYIFDDVNVSYGRLFANHILYYTVTFFEGVLIVTTWNIYSERVVWYNYWMTVVIYINFFLGIVFFRLFYEHQHKHQVRVPIFDCFFGYPDYEEEIIQSEERCQPRII